ncbi:MAG: RMD1 family protein [Chlamydiae bacterium]|nr:RMD1 family protein [Chlamydiota bacterium]
MKLHGTTQLYRDVIHLQVKKEKLVKGDIFFFHYGALVLWGFTIEEEQDFLRELREFERDILAKQEIDEFTFSYGQSMRIDEDQILLHNKNILTKLAISHGIAQSVKLNNFEDLLDKTIEHTKKLPIDLASKGKIGLSRLEISRKMGEIFIERNFINLHSEMLDTPEFFWDHPELETYYRRTIHYLDIGKRIDILNKRLAVVHELFEILSNELRHQHSSRLELTIIVLIVIEVVLAILRDLFHLI